MEYYWSPDSGPYSPPYLKIKKISILLPSWTTTKLFLYETPYTPPSFQKNMRSSLQHSLFTTCLLVFTMNEVCCVSNKYQPSTSLMKYQYFYKRDFISLLHFKIKFALFMSKVVPNIHFIPHFYYFWQWVRFVIFQINTDFLINQLQK